MLYPKASSSVEFLKGPNYIGLYLASYDNLFKVLPSLATKSQENLNFNLEQLYQSLDKYKSQGGVHTPYEFLLYQSLHQMSSSDREAKLFKIAIPQDDNVAQFVSDELSQRPSLDIEKFGVNIDQGELTLTPSKNRFAIYEKIGDRLELSDQISIDRIKTFTIKDNSLVFSDDSKSYEIKQVPSVSFKDKALEVSSADFQNLNISSSQPKIFIASTKNGFVVSDNISNPQDITNLSDYIDHLWKSKDPKLISFAASLMDSHPSDTDMYRKVVVLNNKLQMYQQPEFRLSPEKDRVSLNSQDIAFVKSVLGLEINSSPPLVNFSSPQVKQLCLHPMFFMTNHTQFIQKFLQDVKSRNTKEIIYYTREIDENLFSCNPSQSQITLPQSLKFFENKPLVEIVNNLNLAINGQNLIIKSHTPQSQLSLLSWDSLNLVHYLITNFNLKFDGTKFLLPDEFLITESIISDQVTGLQQTTPQESINRQLEYKERYLKYAGIESVDDSGVITAYNTNQPVLPQKVGTKYEFNPFFGSTRLKVFQNFVSQGKVYGLRRTAFEGIDEANYEQLSSLQEFATKYQNLMPDSPISSSAKSTLEALNIQIQNSRIIYPSVLVNKDGIKLYPPSATKLDQNLTFPFPISSVELNGGILHLKYETPTGIQSQKISFRFEPQKNPEDPDFDNFTIDSNMQLLLSLHDNQIVPLQKQDEISNVTTFVDFLNQNYLNRIGKSFDASNPENIDEIYSLVQFLIDNNYAHFEGGQLTAKPNTPNINILKVNEDPRRFQALVSTIERYTGQHYDQVPHNLSLNGFNLELFEQNSRYVLFKDTQKNIQIKFTTDKAILIQHDTEVELPQDGLQSQAIDSLLSDAYQTTRQSLHPNILRPDSGKVGAYKLGQSLVYFKNTASGYQLTINGESDDTTKSINVTKDSLLKNIYELYYSSYGLAVLGLTIDSNGQPRIQKLSGETLTKQINTTGVQEIELTTAESFNTDCLTFFRGKLSLPNVTELSANRSRIYLFAREFNVPKLERLQKSIRLLFATKVVFSKLEKAIINISAPRATKVDLRSLLYMRGALSLLSVESLNLPSSIPETERYSKTVSAQESPDADHLNYPKIFVPRRSSIVRQFNFSGSNQTRFKSVNYSYDSNIFIYNNNRNELNSDDGVQGLNFSLQKYSQADMPEKTCSIYVDEAFLEKVLDAIASMLSELPKGNHMISKEYKINDVTYLYDFDTKTLNPQST